jgi:hypothetical protein
MNVIPRTDANELARPYWYVIAVAGVSVFVWVLQGGLAYALLSVPVLAVTYWTYKLYYERLNAKTREAEDISKLHLATVEALATAIDAKDQTSHCHVRRVEIYAEGVGRLLGLSNSEVRALRGRRLAP